MAPKKDIKPFELNSKVLCKHGAFFYEAKIIEIQEEDGEPVYIVHYQGWHKRYDDKIPHSHTNDMFLPFTEENIQKAKADIKEASEMSKSSKKKKVKIESLDDDIRMSETGSRASTPSDRVGSSTRAPSTTSDKASSARLSKGLKRKADDTESVITSNPTLGSNAFVQPITDKTLVNDDLELLTNLPLALKQILVDDSDVITRQFKIPKLPARYTVEMIINDYSASAGVSPDDQARDEMTIEYENGSAIVNSVSLIQSVLGLRDYFDILLGFQLLYKFERPQYAEEVGKARAAGLTVGSQEVIEPPAAKRRKRDSIVASQDAAAATSIDPLTMPGELLRPSKIYGLPHLLRLFARFSSLLRVTPWSERTLNAIIKSTHDFIVFLNKNHEKYFNLQKDYETASPEYQKAAWA